ncbi:MAG: virulence protein RhuM/Fic/DOC family protein [Candidatus Omnitrophota bacterium]|nr:MAG: virulence protein RhuM/Fic/DOC family protein [Candidatus Omnitrophota bacterium]
MREEKLAKSQIKLYKNKLVVRLDKETVWLTQKLMADLFNTERSVITKHIHNIFKTKELSRKSVCAKFAHTAEDGKVYQTQFYNLDMIVSVGYRVNSKRGTQFRIWATSVLKKHLVEGYTINKRRLKTAEHKYRELQKSLNLLSNVIHLEAISDDAKGLIQVITEYRRALDILDDYDHQKLTVPKGTKYARFELTYNDARKIIDAMKKKFKDSPLVGQEKDESFKSSIGAVYQTFGSKDVYPTVEEKAAHLLYFVTKNHSFVDGNKRIAVALFVCFLQKNGMLLRKDGSRCMDDNALVALTLMVAASKASEKNTVIKVILNLLNSRV